jgi:hypothetical protein
VARTGDATLSWIAPTEDTDGTPIVGLAGYRIYYGASATQMSNVISVSSPTAVAYEISNLAAGTWYFAIAAYNTESEQSALTATISKTI